MKIKNRKLPNITLSLYFIALVIAICIGSSAKAYISVHKEDVETFQNRLEEKLVFRQIDQEYLVEKNSMVTGIPLDGIIRTSKGNEEESMISSTDSLDNPIENNISYGIVKENKVIKNNNSYYTLIKGETVFIKEVKGNDYIIVDREEEEFQVEDTYIELRKIRDKPSRGKTINNNQRGETITKLVTAAYNNLDKPYRYGGIGPNSFDCSGLTYSIFLNELNIKLERTSRSQANNGKKVSRDELIPGDLVFFRTSGKNIGHVGLYVGENKMIHASSGKNKVIITNINGSDYYNTRYVTGRRIIE